jgi:hypothetical protein
MKKNYSHQQWVLYTPKKATEISRYLNEIREDGLMYAPNKVGTRKYATVEVFDSEGYSIGFLV